MKQRETRFVLAAAVMAASAALLSTASAGDKGPSGASRTPVLVELFTSEGCSTCPPADRLLEKLDRKQPVARTETIVLSEHVDYWNQIGWTDPYSSPLFSKRQESYASRFHLKVIYTPEMVVDGTVEFVGGDEQKARQAIESASRAKKVRVQLARIASGMQVEVERLPDPGRAEVYLALAQDAATSDVKAGENKGRRLSHVAVVRRLDQIGSVGSEKEFRQEIPLNDSERDLRAIVFVQESDSGRVLGVARLAAAQ